MDRPVLEWEIGGKAELSPIQEEPLAPRKQSCLLVKSLTSELAAVYAITACLAQKFSGNHMSPDGKRYAQSHVSVRDVAFKV